MLHPVCHGVARGASWVALVLALLPACGCTSVGRPAIAVSSTGPAWLKVTGLDQRSLDRFAALDPERQSAVLQVRVAEAPPDAPAILGDVTIVGRNLAFEPRYPFQTGLKFVARFD